MRKFICLIVQTTTMTEISRTYCHPKDVDVSISQISDGIYVGHDHKVTVVDSNSNKVFTDEFDFNTSTRPLSLNETGSLTYSESDVNTEDPSFVMKGTITVNDDIASNIDSNGSNATFDTVALLMVPTKDLDKLISTIESEGVDVVDQFTFKDLRGGQKGTGPEQTLLVLGSGNDGPSQLISTMESLTPTLPYS
jgi:hypothetical protein